MLIEEQLDTKINIKRILIRDLNKYEKMEGLPDSIRLTTTDFSDIINDDDIEIVVEVMGSADFTKTALAGASSAAKVSAPQRDLIADYGFPC